MLFQLVNNAHDYTFRTNLKILYHCLDRIFAIEYLLLMRWHVTQNFYHRYQSIHLIHKPNPTAITCDHCSLTLKYMTYTHRLWNWSLCATTPPPRFCFNWDQNTTNQQYITYSFTQTSTYLFYLIQVLNPLPLEDKWSTQQCFITLIRPSHRTMLHLHLVITPTD